MNGNPLRRLSVRLTLWHSAAFCLLVVALSAVGYRQLERSLRADLDQQLRMTARSTLPLIELDHGELAWEGGDAERMSPDLPARVEQRRDLIRIVDGNGRVLVQPTALASLPAGAALVHAACAGTTPFATERLGREWVRIHTVPIVKNGACLGAAQVVTSLEPLHRTLRRVVQLAGISVLATVLLSLLIGYSLARRALDPVQAITRTATMIGAGNLSRRLRLPDTGDELGYLAASFDAMLDRLEAAYRRQREFAADASHELRTPLALIKGETSLALRPGTPAGELRAALVSIDLEADRLTRLVEDLLLLARLDQGELLRSDPVGLDEVAQDVVARLAPLARERGVSLRIDAPEAVVVRGDETALLRVLLNLGRNALEHTRSGEIRVRVAAGPDGAGVEVADTGSGIPAAQLDRVFERFFRVDEARTGGGAGLGLALCRDIVVAHGGTIRIASEEGRGTVVSFSLPLLVSAT